MQFSPQIKKVDITIKKYTKTEYRYVFSLRKNIRKRINMKFSLNIDYSSSTKKLNNDDI